jgi:hypothetical protein
MHFRKFPSVQSDLRKMDLVKFLVYFLGFLLMAVNLSTASPFPVENYEVRLQLFDIYFFIKFILLGAITTSFESETNWWSRMCRPQKPSKMLELCKCGYYKFK